MTRLYELRRGNLFKIVDNNIHVPPGAPEVFKESVYKLHNIDGMFSFCTDENKQVVHIAAYTEVEEI